MVDNVYQDIPMASVMLSSIGGFTEEELTKLRILVREPMREQYTLYDLMCLYLQEGAEEELRAKIQHFIKIYNISASKRSSHWECCYGIFIRELVLL